jgi:hypothetical protein
MPIPGHTPEPLRNLAPYSEIIAWPLAASDLPKPFSPASTGKGAGGGVPGSNLVAVGFGTTIVVLPYEITFD